MKHFIFDADPDLIPYFEDLYVKQGYDFTLQYGIGDYYLLTTNQDEVYLIALQQKGAREVVPPQMKDSFQNMADTFWLGNEDLVLREW